MSKFNIDDAFALADELDNQREWADTPKEFAAGANTMLSSALGSLDKSKLGDIARLLKGKPTKSDVEFARLYQKDKAEQLAKEYLDAGTIFQDGQEVLNEGSQYWLDKRSPKAKRVDEYIEQGTGFTDTIGRYAENPAAIVGHTVRNLPQLMPLLALKNAPVSAQMNLGNVYQGEVGGQQAREQSLQDSKAQNALDRFNSANEAQGLGSAISQAAGTIGLRGDTAMLNLLTGQGTKGLTTKSLKEAGKYLGLNVAEETIDEGGSPFATNIAAKQNYDKGRDVFKDVGKQAAAGAVIGAGMGSVQAGSLAIFGDNQNTNNQNNLAQAIINTIPKQDIPKQYQNAFNAFEDAKQAEAQAQAAYEANPTPESEEALAQATDSRLKANNKFSQYDAAFKQTFTEQEQQDLLANSLSGIAARAKLAEEAKQAELNSKAEQEALAKAQRANMVKSLAAYADNESVLINEVNQLGLDDTQKELLLREVFAERKNAKAKPQQTQTKTPLELAVDEHFDAKGNRKPSVMSSDVADKHKVSLNELLPAIAKRNNDIKIQKAQAEKQAKQQAQLDEDAKAFQQSQAKLEADAKRKAQAQQKAKEQGLKQDALTEQQQLENTLADFAAENDTDSMLSMLEGYDKTEADRLFNNAFKTVETRAKEAEKATKAKEAETAKQAQAKQKQSVFNADMSALYESNPNATYNDWKAVGKKHGITSAIDLANAWASAAKKPKTEQKSTETLALPAPNTIMVTDAQGNTTPTTENNVPKKQRNADVSIPSGLKVDVSNAENTQSDLGIGSYIGSAMIVRQDGQPFPTEQVAQQALENKATKKPRRKNEQSVSKDTHSVVPIDGGFAIAPVEDITGNYRNKSSDDIITVRKTETGYDLDFDGVVQYYDGEDSLKEAKSFLRKYGFKKIKPKVESEWQATPKEPVVEQPIEEVKQEPVLEPKVEKPIIDDLSGDYAHTQLPDAVATVSKTEKGYDINWGDEVQSFTGKNAAEKTQAALKKENFNKKNPDDDNGGVAVEPTPKKPVSPVDNAQTTPKVTQNTTGEQIAEAMDKTAKAITEAAHNKVVERVKNGEEIVYKQPAAIERVKQDERYQVEINDKGHAVVKNIKDLNGEWVKKDEPKQAKNYSDKDIEKAIKKWEELSQSMRSGILTRLDNGWYVEKKKTGVVSRYEFTNGEQYLANSKKNDSNQMYGFIYFAMDAFGDLKTALDVSGVLNRLPQKEAADLTTKLKEMLKQGKISKEDYSWSTLVINDAVARDGKPSTVKSVETIKKQFISPLSAPKNEPIAANTKAEAVADWESKTDEQSNSTIEETKQPTKKERLLIKIDDELDAALDDFAAIFKEQGKRLSSGVDPVIMGKVLAIGMKASTLYLAKGAVKFAVWAENIIAALSSKGVPQETVQPYLKGLYLASKAESSPEIRQQMDKEDDVYDFDFAILNVAPTPKAEAVHIEDGKAEEVTPEIIRESLAKVDDKPINGLTMSLKQGKQWLLNEANTALANAKDEEKAAEAKRVLAVAKAKEELAVAEKALEEKKARNALLVNQNSKADADEELKLRNDLYDKKMAVIHAGKKVEPERDYVTFKVPNDGSFKVLKTVSALESFIKKVKANRGFDKQSPKKLFPAVPQNSVDTTIAEFLGDGEVENAYEFAKLQDRPIRFGVGNSQGRENTNAYALTEPVDLGGGFKGFVGLSLDTTKKQWIFIEENTRLSIGLFDDTKDKAIKNAKDKLAGLSESDKAKMLVKAKETKIKKTDAELEQQWLSQIGYNPNQNEDEAKAELKAKNEQKQAKPFSAPSENSPETTIMGFLNDDELENAYFFAENQDKPIKFTLSRRGEPIAYFLTEPVDLGNNITGFVGISTYPMSKSKRWLVIEEKSRTSIGFEEISKRAAIKSAKARLSALKKEDLEGFASKITPINKTDEEMKADWLAKNNIKIDEQSNEENSINRKTENLAPVEKAQQAKKDAFLNTEIDSQYGKVTKRQLIDNLINDGWTLTTGWTEDKAKGKALDAELERLKRTAPIGNSSHPDTVRLNELKNLAKESPHKERGQFFFKETTYRLESPTGQLKQLSKTELDYVNEVLSKKEPKPVAAEQEPAKTDEKTAEKPSISDKQANREKIRITMLQATNREKALALAVKLTEEMPDMDYEITSELQSVIQHNKWLGIEIKMPKTPFKGDSDAEVKKSITQLKKAFDGTGYSFNLIGLDKNSVMGQLSFSKDFSTRLNYIRNSKDIWVLFDNNYSNAGSLEFLDPVAKAITKWLNGENVEPFMAGIDPNWDIQFRSIPRVIADKLSAAKEKGENSTSKVSTLTESKTINDSKKEDSIQPTSKTPLLDKNNNFMDLVRDGKATAEEFKQSFDDLFANKDAVIAELNTLTKDQLLKKGGYNIQYRYKNDKKSEVAEAVYDSMIAKYALGRGITSGMGKNSYENAVKKMVDDTDQSRLDDFAKEYKQMIDDRAKKIAEKVEALKNPQTLEDYRNLVRSKMADGSTRQEAFLSLTPEQRIKYDELEAESTKETREAKKRALQSTVNTASQTTTGTIIETKHTRDGYDLFVVQLSDRLSTDDYKQVLSEAKRLGGWYSSFRGNGAIAGFQFKDKGSAEAFLALAGGDTTAAKEQIDAKIDAFEDNRSQTAVERLQAMADKLEEKANEELERDRLVNTARRARFAASAEFAARSQIALAKTMRNIADAISSGKAKFLDNIRMKTDVETLQSYIASAKDNEIRAKYKTYAEQEKRKGQPATVETADFATYPSYTMYRSDLAMLGRKLLEIEGLKKFGQQIMAVADDVSDAYLEFAKKNLHQVSRFSKGDSSLATFSSKDIAERSIRKSGLTGKAIVLQVKRGENIIILSPSEAINLKVWEGDADKRITLKREFGNDLVNAVGRRAGKNNNLLPYQFQLNYDKFKALSRMGIETPSEFRSALREFIALQEEVTNNKVREMELAMVGRKNDGLDFFPTPQVITQQMIEAAEITPDMAVLEPSAGMGHIADMIRATGAEPDVIEMSGERRELLKEKGYHLSETRDFMDMQPRKFFTYGDVFRAPDGKEGVMRGSSGQRVMLLDSEGNSIGYYNRDELEGVRHQGVDSGYDRIIMNPPFSNRQDAEHVRHAYDLLKPNGRIVAIMGEGVFFGRDKKAVEFREWLDSVGGTSEKLPDNSFMDKSLPVNTGVNARMVVIDKQESNNQDTDNKPKFSRSNRVSDIDNLYLDAIKRGDIEEAQRLVIEAAEKAGVPIINDESATAYKVRRSATPIRTQKAYKLFRVKKSQKGEVFALFVGNKDPLPQGVWLDAIPGEAALNPKTGEPTKVKSSLGALAYRPGWHAGDIPLATHIGAMDKEGNIFARKDDEVWAEVEMIADIDYQPEANENGIRNGKFSPAYADIKRMPVDGLYRYKTNANMTGNWIISSSMKINKILTEDEVNSILIANNAKTMPWAKEVKTKDKTEKTDSRSQKVWEKTNLDLAKWGLTDNPAKNQQKLLDPITYDDNGNIIPLSERFNIESDDPRYSSQSSTIGDRTITQVREKLSSRFVKRIVELLESKGILKIHQSMSDKDIPAEALRQVAYHGSPYKFDKFSLEHLGKGEGAQVYGWGLYFTDLKEIASGYADKLTKHSIYVNGKEVDSLRGTPLYDVSLFIFGANNIAKEQGKESAISNLKQAIRDGRIDYNEATKAIKYLESLNSFSIKKDKQQLYKVNIPEDNTMLLWDSWTNTQSDDVIKGLLSASNDNAISEEMRNDLKRIIDKGIWTGESIYKELQREFNSDKEASLFLKKHGINGIKYLDGSSRFAGTGTYNYVIFDDNAVEILKTYYSAQQGVTEGFYFNGTVHLIADNLTDETIIPTFVHELSGHKGFQEMMSPKAYELIMQQFDRLVAQGNSIAIKAKQRAEKAEKDTARQQDEYIPYLLTKQEKAQFATPQERNAVKRLIDHIVRAVKGWVVRHLSKYDTTYKMSRRVSESLTPADIFYMAERMVGEIAKYEKPISPNKQSGMARREFLGLLGASVGVAALGGGATLIDQSIKNNAKETVKEKVNSLAENTYNEIIKQLNKSDAFVKLAQNIAKAKPSIIGKASAENGFYSITDTYRMEKMYANNEQSNLIDTGLRYKDDGTPIFVSRDDVLKKASDTHALLSENEQKIIAIMSDAIGFVEAITGQKFKKLGIKATTNAPVADILARKKLGLKNHDTNINALVEHDNPSTVLIHPQTMVNLVSTNEKARLHAFQTLSHELVHVLQNQENGVASNKGIGVNIDTPVLLKNMISNILGNEYNSSEQIQNETEAFHVGYLATKALLLKEGKPLSAISKDEFLNIINASIDSFTTEQQVIDKFYRNVTFLDAAQFSKTEQSQFDRLLAKADKMIAEQGKLLAPNGKPSKLNRYQWAQVRTDNFKAWFGDWENDPANASKVKDENGEPMVVYHGSPKEGITEFYTFTSGIFGAGTYFTIHKHEALSYSGEGGSLYPAFISMKNPMKIPANAFDKSYFKPASQEQTKSLGYDGVVTGNGKKLDIEYVIAFDQTQIKSAIGNNGEFSPTNPDIRFSRAEDKAKAAKDYVLDSVRIKKEVAANLNAKKELWWWHKTFGTQQNTAIQYKDFGRVYKTLQRLLQHQSSDVMDALEVAPTLLEKLDSLSDLKEQGKSIGRNIAQYARKVRTGEMTDREAVAKVIFGETLAKEALSQADLEQKLTPQQLKIYEEARAAINVSLKNTAKSEIIRSLLQNDVINFDTVEKLLNQQTGFDEFIDEMLENVGARISNAQAELSQAKSAVRAGVKLITKAESDLVKATDKAQQKEIGKEIKLLTKTQEGLEKAEQEIKDELKRLADMYNSISDVNTKVYKLIDEAYAPLMRFGDYALTMRDKTTGKVLSFMMFESKAERNRMVNYLGTEYGDTVTLETDTMSTEDFKMFKGVTPETVALFAKELGLDKNEAYQGYLKLAIPATSALTRRIHRKGTEGYNEDIQRVLASFVMSNARYSAKNIYLAKADREINDIESGKSIKDQAIKMRDNTINPADTSAWLRDLLFVWNLGGSVMFAFLNMTQPFMQTIPMLSQYVNTGFATKHVLRGIGVAGKAMATGNAPKGYEAEYKRAVHEGIVDPQNTFMLTGLERGGTGTTSKIWTGTKHILGLFAQMSESLNRKAVFIASLEVANAKGGAWLKQKGYASAYDFAVDVISQTQGVYNKANRSNWAHSQLGAPLLVFKQFSINYVEQMIRMLKNQSAGEEGKKAVLLMLFMLFSLAGGMGLPFIKDIFDGSETIAAFMGNPVNIEREMRLMGKQYLGETTTGALMDGWLNKLVIGEVLGADVQSRTGMGDLIPMTNVFNPVLSDSQRVNEAASIFGAAGGLGEKAGDSIQFAANDEFGDAFINILPRFATSMYRGVEMMTTGETTDSKGRKLFDTTFGEGLVKFFDSQPVRMAELSRARGLEYDDIAIQRSKIDYYRKKWIKAAQKEDDEAIEQIEQDIEDWNENNEKYPVIFDRQRAYQSANKNEMTWGEREERTPKGMDWLQEERPDWLNE